jgi:hypothetical protein
VNDYIGVCLAFAPIALLGWFFVWDGGTAQDDQTRELAHTPLHRWRRSPAIAEADTVASSRYRIGRSILCVVLAGWPIAIIFVY